MHFDSIGVLIRTIPNRACDWWFIIGLMCGFYIEYNNILGYKSYI